MKVDIDSIVAIPVGGCDAIGMNMMLYFYKQTWIMVDCGVGFADSRIMPGVDLIVPNILFLKEQNIKISALILTHAHEDHIGGVCYLWDQLKCPVYATVFAANVLRAKAIVEGIDKEIDIHEVKGANARFSIGSFDIEMVGLTHSIVEMNGLLITAGSNSIFHSGDWKIDNNPVVGNVSDVERLREIGNNGLLALLCDSTNVFQENASGSESTLKESLLELITSRKNRIVVTMFSSNVARIQILSDIAKLVGRKLVVTGSSLYRSINVSKKSGYLLDVDYIDMKNAAGIPRGEILLLATGSQGEPLASIAKMSSHRHPLIKLSPGDTVIFSSREIPTNTQKIFDSMNRFVRNGIEVISDRKHHVHVSGHPGKPELHEMYNILKPKIVIPVHGSPLHIQEHCLIARNAGIDHVFATKNGDVLSISNNGVMRIDEFDADFFGIDGLVFRNPGDRVMRERRKVVRGGAIFCFIVLNSGGKVISEIKILSAGSFDPSVDKDFVESIESDIVKIIMMESRLYRAKIKDSTKLMEAISSRISFITKKVLGTEPLVKVSITEI